MDFIVKLEGGKRVSTQIGDHQIMTDQPAKHGGDDCAPAPAPCDLLVASIGTCAGFYVQSYCQSKGIDWTGIDITLTLKRDLETKKISGFVTTIHVPEGLPKKTSLGLEEGRRAVCCHQNCPGSA